MALIKGSRAVALLDVLGFSSLIRHAGTDGLDSYLDRVIKAANLYVAVDTILFSDTVVLYAFDDKDESIDLLLELTSVLSYELLLADVPTRGAVAYGEIAVSERQGRGVVVAGVPIVDAHLCESQTDWSGTMLTPSMLKRIGDLSRFDPLRKQEPAETRDDFRRRIARTARVQRCARIPFKDRSAHQYLEGFGIVPLPRPLDDLGQLNQGLSATLDRLRWLEQLAPDPRSQAKYQHSISWLEGFVEPWHTLSRQ